MATFKPTEEQQAIVDHLTSTNDNIVVKARAGCGKTSTIELMAKAMNESSALCLAFNKSIATEMQERLPKTCTVSTLNALGHRAWGFTVGKRLHVDTAKNYNLLRSVVNALSDGERESLERDSFSEMLKAIAYGKRHGYVPAGVPGTKSLLTDQEFFDSTETELTHLQEQIVKDVSRRSFEDALQGNIDFDDQILCPTLYQEASFKRYPLTLIDEAQDLSELNHEMLSKLVGNKRLIAVGDDFQAIYAFRGADERSMASMAATFNMVEFRLTVSFRCAEDIIKNVHWRAPEMKWRDGAPLGEVVHFKSWTHKEISDYGAIVCRNNAPLFEMALNLLESGRRPRLSNRDVVEQLLKIFQGFGSADMEKTEVLEAVERWRENASKKSRNKEQIDDIARCLEVLASRNDTLGETIRLTETISNQKGGIYMSSIHKSKGLEWTNVYILDSHLIRKGEGQEDNVRYVAETRAKEFLGYIYTEGFTPTAELES